MCHTVEEKFIESLVHCPKCCHKLNLYGKHLVCCHCHSLFKNEDGVYNLLVKNQLDGSDIEQQIVYDKTSRAYDEYLITYPFYVYIRDKYVLPFWQKENFRYKSVLDIGCGTAWASSPVLSQALVLVNLDISKENLRVAQERLGNRNTFYIQADMKQLPFQGEAFDIVTCFWALHHIADTKRVVTEVKRVLKQKGTFLGIEPNQKYSWVEFWSDILHLPFSLKKALLRLHKQIQRYTHKRLEKEEIRMKGIKLKYDLHTGKRDIKEYQNIFNDLSLSFEFQPIGLEIIPPRFFLSRNRVLVNHLLRCSDWCIAKFHKKNKAYFNVMKAQKTNNV